MKRNKPEVIAAGLTTLDEARYFAAMGADWLGFDLQKISVEALKTISEWVVGPKLFVATDSIQEDLLFELTQKIGLHGICTTPQSAFPEWYTGTQIILITNTHDLENVRQSDPVILYFSQNDYSALRETLIHSNDQRALWIEYEINSIAFQTPETLLDGIVIRSGAQPETENPYDLYDAFFEKVREISGQD